MSDQPKPQAFAVALVFGSGPIHLNAIVAPDAVAAGAIAGVNAGRQFPGSQLTGSAAIPLSAEWLRQALRMVEGGRPGGEIVSLVSDNPRPAQPPPCARHPFVVVSPCPICEREANMTPFDGPGAA